LSRLLDFHEIWKAGDAIQGDLDAIILNSIASTILKKGGRSNLRGECITCTIQPCSTMSWDYYCWVSMVNHGNQGMYFI
jgi:hypothetical protein